MSNPTDAIRYVKGDKYEQLACIEHPLNGTMAYDLGQADTLLIEFWKRASEPPESTIEQTDARIRRLIDDCYTGRPQDRRAPTLTAAHLKRRIANFKSNAAGGPGGWQVTDLKQLPDTALEELLHLYQSCVDSGRTPERWQ
eukprot:5468874-Amphidinium_carterae.1